MNEEKNWAKIVLGLVLFVPSLLFSIFVIATIWNWYMPLFGFASIKMVQAFGLSLLVSLLTAKIPSKIEVENKYSSLEKGLFHLQVMLYS